MIIQVRGTSGSGKSTVMRAVMNSLFWNGVRVEGRKKPLYYASLPDQGCPNTVILGHYESPCGGCDTIGSARVVYELVQSLRNNGSDTTHFLCEGLLLSEDTKWTSKLFLEDGEDVRCLFLITPLGECIERIKNRRALSGNEKPLNEKNTCNRVSTIERARLKLLEAGIICRRATSEQASGIVLKWLREGGANAK